MLVITSGCSSEKPDPALTQENAFGQPTQTTSYDHGTSTYSQPGAATTSDQQYLSNPNTHSPTVVADSTAANAAYSSTGTTTEVQQPKVPPKKLPLDTGPDAIVWEFLNSLKTGHDSMAESLLTQKARDETAKHDLAVLPPGAPQASFNVGQVQFIEDGQGAWVPCTWTELDAQNQPETDHITWALRYQPETGWRIAGMATELIPSQPPLFLNFEDPQDMIAKLKDAATYLATQRRDNGVQQAQQPANNGNTLR